jgi:carbohydrate kinase (thermoresistant glucokinase family)
MGHGANAALPRLRVMNPTPIVVMGVEGSGKSTVGLALSERLGYEFIDADGLHPLANKEKMASGEPLNDEDRLPWLRAVGSRIAEISAFGDSSVTACSALKRAYRDLLRQYAPNLFFAFLDGPLDVVRARVEQRHHEFMPAALLESQFATLEPLAPDERGVRIDLRMSPMAQVDEIVKSLPTP